MDEYKNSNMNAKEFLEKDNSITMTKADIASEVLRKHPENNLQARIFTTNQVLICMDEWVHELSKIGESASVSDLLFAFLEFGKERHYTPLTQEQMKALVNDFTANYNR